MSGGRDQHADDVWKMGHRQGKSFLWRECTCDDWDAGEAPIEPGEPHTRERVPDAPVEVCYYVNRPERVITILKIRTMDKDGAG